MLAAKRVCALRILDPDSLLLHPLPRIDSGRPVTFALSHYSQFGVADAAFSVTASGDISGQESSMRAWLVPLDPAASLA